nr:hypothetical protein [Feifania hominis]
MIRCGERVAVNLCNIGFDARVAKNMVRFKKLPLVSGSAAYTLSLVGCFFTGLFSRMNILLDGEQRLHGRYLLAVAANGICYGGGYYPTPEARIDDGLIEFCAVKKLSRLSMARLIKSYKCGEHLHDDRFAPHLHYRRCRTLTVEGERDLVVCLDGEIFTAPRVELEILPGALAFLVPAGCALPGDGQAAALCGQAV